MRSDIKLNEMDTMKDKDTDLKDNSVYAHLEKDGEELSPTRTYLHQMVTGTTN